MKNIVRLIAVLFFCSLFSSCNKYLGDPTNSLNYDADAQKFFDSARITDLTEQFAINNFVKQLKDSALWTKFAAIYPMVGGADFTAKWNLKDPRNLDVAYRLTFHGLPVYSGTGVLFPTTADYADTHLTDSALIYNDNSISYYSVTQNTVSGYDMGCSDSVAPFNEMAIYNKYDAAVWFGYYYFGPAPVNTKGLFMLSATASIITRYENGAVRDARGMPAIESTGFPILIGSVQGAPSVGKRGCGLATIGNGLTDAEALTFYNIVQNLETTLGRI
jgi:hypothetical protein